MRRKHNNKSDTNKPVAKRLQVPAVVLKKWKQNYDHGDIEAIRKLTNLATSTTSNAMKGLATKEVQDTLTRFFQNKQAAR